MAGLTYSGPPEYKAVMFFFLKRFIAHKISEIHRLTKLRNCSFKQFALVVPRRASDRECTILGSYEYSSEKQVQRKSNAAAVMLNRC